MPIRSLHIIGSRTAGGAERFFAQLTNHLHRNGQPASAVLRPQSPLTRMVSVPLHLAAMRNAWDLASAWRIHRLIRRETPDIVQTFMGRATRLTRLPKEGPVHVARLGGFYKLAHFRHAHAWIGNTQAICDYLRKGGFPTERVFHVPNFVDPIRLPTLREQAAFRASFGIPTDALVILSAGRFVEKKGFGDLLQAFGRLPPTIHGRPVHLLILGDGPLNRTLRLRAKKLDVGSRTHWPGWQDNISPFFAAADLFVCPSRHEPLGNVILDAWNHGLAVVATDTHGARELIEDGTDARVAPHGNIRDLTRLLEELLRDDCGRRELGDAGYKCLLRNYSPERIGAAYIEVYTQLLRGKEDARLGPFESAKFKNT